MLSSVNTVFFNIIQDPANKIELKGYGLHQNCSVENMLKLCNIVYKCIKRYILIQYTSQQICIKLIHCTCILDNNLKKRRFLKLNLTMQLKFETFKNLFHN